MRGFFFTIFILFSIPSFSQTKSLKLYSNFLYPKSERYRINLSADPNHGFKFEHFTLAFRNEKEKSFWEYEVGFVKFNKTNALNKIEHTDFHFRVERGFKIRESSNGKFKFYISPALKGYYFTEKEITSIVTTSTFPKTNWLGGINVALFIGGQYHFSEKLYLDINTTFIGAHFGVDFQKVENPLLTERQQTQGGFDFDILHEQLIRIGVGYKF